MYPEESLWILLNYVMMKIIAALMLSTYLFSASQQKIQPSFDRFLNRVLVLKRQFELTLTGSSAEVQYTAIGLY